jgi:hypothetical protein
MLKVSRSTKAIGPAAGDEDGNNKRDDESDSEGDTISHATVQSHVWSLSAPPSGIDSGNNTQTTAISDGSRSTSANIPLHNLWIFQGKVPGDRFKPILTEVALASGVLPISSAAAEPLLNGDNPDSNR